jgi:cold shock CspA family protein
MWSSSGSHRGIRETTAATSTVLLNVAAALAGELTGETSVSASRPTGVRRVALGTVRWFSAEGGFGFIVDDSGGNGALFHTTHAIAVGDRVEFEPVVSPEGLEALNVRRHSR